MLDKEQKQNVASGGTAIQAGGSVLISNSGLSYSEVRAVAMDVFKANFYQLSNIAAESAKTRAQEITENFLSKLEKENPSGILKANDPNFQYALFTAQREYACCGDKDLESLLVDLLIDRSKQKDRDILQIVLNESITIAPKLTEGQLAVLALIFLFKYTQNFGIGNHDLLGEYLDKHAAPFIAKASSGYASYQHLEFTGCGAVGIGERNLDSILSHTYQGLFLKGFDAGEIAAKQISIGNDARFFMNCLNDPSKIQIRANSKELLGKKFDEFTINEFDRNQISGLFEVEKMSDSELREKCVDIRPYMNDLFDLWSSSAMKNLTLTSVGMAIGHANIKRLVGEFSDLSIWIN